MDVEILSRIQFALTAGFHFLFPPLSIGLGVFIVLVEAMWVFTNNIIYKQAAMFFTKLFGLIFAAGVMTGIVMLFEFGTNWPVYSNFVGDVFGSPLAIEAVFAFTMESVFLGIALWGWKRVGKKTHFFATIMVCIGAHLSSVWILAANSFMQTPAGYKLVTSIKDGGNEISITMPEGFVPPPESLENTKALITDFWAMAFSDSCLDRIGHTVSASWLAGAFLAMGILSYYILKRRNFDFAKPCLKIAIYFAMVSAVFMFFTGHHSARKIATTQPEKLSAFEGHFETQKDAGLYLWGWVDEENQTTYGLKISGWFSYLAFGNFSAEVRGLKELPDDAFLKKIHPELSGDELAKVRPQYWAPVNLTFQLFRMMVYLGGAMIALCMLGFYLTTRRKIFDLDSRLSRIFLYCAIPSVALPILASQFGWAAAEVGRQPWIVWHILKTQDAVTTSVGAGQILFSIIMFLLIFSVITCLFLYVFLRKVKEGYTETLNDY